MWCSPGDIHLNLSRIHLNLSRKPVRALYLGSYVKEHDDLPTVLKALYTQQAFADFIATNQHARPDALHAAFGDFLKRHAPGEVSGPTQQPGVISDSAPQPRAGL